MLPMSMTHPILEKLTYEIAQAQELLNSGQNQAARKACEQALAAAARLGLVAPDACWLTAVAADNERDLEAAVRFARRALQADPTSPAYRRSFDVIRRRVREALLDDKLALGDAGVPGLHALAVDANAADEACHLRLAHYLLAAGRLDEARAVLASVTLLNPGSIDAWVLLSQTASSAEDDELSGRCKGKIERLRQMSLAFPQAVAEA